MAKYKPNHPSEKDFLRQVAQHEMTVLRDSGLDHHLRFRRTETSNQYFDLITWPGVLCYHGDMGTFVFSRIPDMFEFFRNDRNDGHLFINLGYWAEKLDADDRRTGGHEKFNPELFKHRVMDYAKQCGAKRAAINQIKDRVLPAADDGEFRAYETAGTFEHEGFRLYDFWEINCREYTYHFVWCCYAIVWGIQKYDEFKIGLQKSAAA